MLPVGSETRRARYWIVKAKTAGGRAFWRSLLNYLVPGRYSVKALKLHSRAQLYILPGNAVDHGIKGVTWVNALVIAVYGEIDYSQWCRSYSNTLWGRDEEGCIDIELEVKEQTDEWGFKQKTILLNGKQVAP